MVEGTGSRRQARTREQRVEEILDAALQLFHERGFDATTVQHIAEAAGVAAGTLYLYFASKEHVLLAVHDRFHAAMWRHLDEVVPAAIAGAAGRDAGAGIDAMVDGVAEFLLWNRQTATVICRYLPRLGEESLHGRDAMVELVAAALTAAVEAGRLHVSDPQMAARLLVAALREPLVHAVVDGRRDDVDRLAAQAKELFRKALAP